MHFFSETINYSGIKQKRIAPLTRIGNL